jgi:cytochrome c oxidase subunit II
MPWMPILASEHGGTIDLVLVLIHLVMLAALLLWGGFFAYSVVRFRRAKQPNADYDGLKSRIPYVAVALMALVEGVILVAISFPFWEEHVVAGAERAENPFEVRVLGQQFQWTVHYPGADGQFGRTLPELVEELDNPVGLDPTDPFSDDDIVARNMLYVPVNRPVVVHLSSKDVIHSFALPEFRVKQDAIPGMRIPVTFTATMTTAELREMTGNDRRDFEIACAQLCGLGHFQMRGFVRVVQQDEFDAWYQNRLEIKREYED